MAIEFGYHLIFRSSPTRQLALACARSGRRLMVVA
jgi:hypothetical protein